MLEGFAFGWVAGAMTLLLAFGADRARRRRARQEVRPPCWPSTSSAPMRKEWGNKGRRVDRRY